MPEQVEECVASIQEDNPEMDESTAYAICQDMADRDVLADYLAAEPDPTDEALAALAEFREPGSIKRLEADGGGVRYSDVMLLAPGAWTDAGSRSTAVYTDTAIRASAENWVDPATQDPVDRAEINLLHGPALHDATTLGDVGHVPTDSIVVDEQNRMFGDLVLHGESAASELAIELMDEVLEATEDPDREAPPVGPSVEIVDERGEVDREAGVKRLEELWYSGLGIVFNPASRPVELAEQTRERAVAMADGSESALQGVVLRAEDGTGTTAAGDTDGETTKPGSRPALTMSEREHLQAALSEMQTAFQDMARLLQSDEELAMVQDLIAEFQQAGNEPSEATVAELLEWADANADVDRDVMEDVLDAFMQTVEADDPGAVAVEGLADWIAETGGGGEDDETDDADADSGEEGEEGNQLSQDDLQNAVDTIAQFSSQLEDVKEMLAEAESVREDHAEMLAALEADLEDVDRRLTTYEDEPQPRSLAGGDDEPFVEDEGESTAATEHEDVLL